MYHHFHYFHPAKTDESKSSVRNDLQRTGAELFNFLVFRKYFGQIVAKNESFEMNYSLYCISYEVYLTVLLLDVNNVNLTNTLPTIKKRLKN